MTFLFQGRSFFGFVCLNRPKFQGRCFTAVKRKMYATLEVSDRPLLVDVDCNLLHKDLVFFGRYGVLGPQTADTEKDDDEHIFDILRHPSTQEANLHAVFSPSSTMTESGRSVELISKMKNSGGIHVKTSVGIHPYHTKPQDTPKPSEQQIQKLKQLIDTGINSKVVSCVGECGLDYSPSFPPKEDQIPWFQAQLKLAIEYNLPIFVHERLAFKDTLYCIDEAMNSTPKAFPKIIIHCFTGTKEECSEYVRRGYYIGLTGFLRKENVEGAAEIRSILEDGIISLDRLMIETDAPYLGFTGCRDLYLKFEEQALSTLNGKQRKRQIKSITPNVPSSLPMILSAVTESINKGRKQRGQATITEDEVARQTTRNAIDFFGFPNVA